MLECQYVCYCLTFWLNVHQAESVTESQEEIIVQLFHVVLSAVHDLKELIIIIVINLCLWITTVNSV
jgi:hypothetical protein